MDENIVRIVVSIWGVEGDQATFEIETQGKAENMAQVRGASRLVRALTDELHKMRAETDWIVDLHDAVVKDNPEGE